MSANLMINRWVAEVQRLPNSTAGSEKTLNLHEMHKARGLKSRWVPALYQEESKRRPSLFNKSWQDLKNKLKKKVHNNRTANKLRISIAGEQCCLEKKRRNLSWRKCTPTAFSSSRMEAWRKDTEDIPTREQSKQRLEQKHGLSTDGRQQKACKREGRI